VVIHYEESLYQVYAPFTFTFTLLHFFARATLCLSAGRSLLSPAVRLFVCLSVCLSVTLVHCIQMAEDIVKLLSLSCSPSF